MLITPKDWLVAFLARAKTREQILLAAEPIGWDSRTIDDAIEEARAEDKIENVPLEDQQYAAGFMGEAMRSARTSSTFYKRLVWRRKT